MNRPAAVAVASPSLYVSAPCPPRPPRRPRPPRDEREAREATLALPSLYLEPAELHVATDSVGAVDPVDTWLGSGSCSGSGSGSGLGFSV